MAGPAVGRCFMAGLVCRGPRSYHPCGREEERGSNLESNPPCERYRYGIT
ncbi:predicted protein [Plenodomus lingam JN3]|uniref:Predicted protein n=1 Tax=Leptosphaeria maculans (strain JN3 / isolate v23.1.3 / race Av1-4-5-6-7-8) TaxID=985895 RepID=E5A5C4_LEPMJ|nr:predicted protein [Plenodomus lingam JN3]CBX98822.1 predicted protein [Plenodomus lingam JN3]